MKWYWMLAVAALAMSSGKLSAADTPPGISAVAIPAVNCIHHLLQSDEAVRSAELYAIDGFRSAIEFRFSGRDGKIVTADLRLNADLLYGITVPRAESQESGFASTEFLTHLEIDSKCRVSPAFDNLIPRPKPRSEWRRIDWSDI